MHGAVPITSNGDVRSGPRKGDRILCGIENGTVCSLEYWHSLRMYGMMQQVETIGMADLLSTYPDISEQLEEDSAAVYAFWDVTCTNGLQVDHL
jgi:hypothetical protein